MKQIDRKYPARSGDHPEGTETENGLTRALHQLTPPTNGHDKAEKSLPTAEEVEELAFYGLAEGAIALLSGCSPSDLNGKFAHAIAHGRARQQQFLLEKLADRIEANEWAALRFALKNVVGMADNPEQAALQRRKLAQLREQDAARSAMLPEPPPAPAPELRPSGPALEPAAPAVGSPEQAKPPARVHPRPRYSSQPPGGQHATTSTNR